MVLGQEQDVLITGSARVANSTQQEIPGQIKRMVYPSAMPGSMLQIALVQEHPAEESKATDRSRATRSWSVCGDRSVVRRRAARHASRPGL